MTVANDEVFFHSANNTRLANLRGQFDENIKLIESGIDVEIGSRGVLSFVQAQRLWWNVQSKYYVIYMS